MKLIMMGDKSYWILILVFTACMAQTEQDTVFEKFKKKVEDAGFSIDSVGKDGLVFVNANDLTLQISLDNLRKGYERDKDESYIDDFVNVIVNQLGPVPDWQQARNEVFFSLFPSDFDFGEFFNEKITDEFHKIYVHNSKMKVTWVDKSQLDEWDISKEEFVNQVEVNMMKGLEMSSIEIEDIEGHKLGFIDSGLTFKSALLFAENFKEKVKPAFGWPVYCVLPVRDFCYIFSEQDKDYFLDHLGGIVLEEYNESGYKVTTEVLKISDDGIYPIGKY